jgi:hypothetical protein
MHQGEILDNICLEHPELLNIDPVLKDFVGENIKNVNPEYFV